MKIKRFFAPDMRQAIRKVREEQGPDAVILSNRKVEGGVEIVAAIDYDESVVDRVLGQGMPAAERPPAAAGKAGSYAAIQDDVTHIAPKPMADEPTSKEMPRSKPAAAPRKDIVWEQDPALVEMRQEIHELRGLLENQLARLAWGELRRNRPVRADLLQRLTALGLTSDLAADLSDAADDGQDIEMAWRRALGLLAERLPVTDDDILSTGGVVALVGSTGVGKTTTVAKLAARFALRHGHRNVALITTDSYRIGAHEQLFTYGRILGVPVQVASDHNELQTALKSLSDKRLVLIDTAGMSLRDVRLSEQFATLRDAGMPIRTYLAMAATTQASVLREAIKTFSSAGLDGCILTKVDEAASLGDTLALVAEYRLPLAYIGDGQRVPEDLHPARSHSLVNRAVSLMQQTEQDTHDDTLAERFGGMAAHAHI